jgi:hypothetical protein
VVGARFGEFIDYDEATASRARLDVARLKISTSIRSRIEASVEIVVMGMVFELWVVEEEVTKRNIVVEEGVQGSDRSWGVRRHILRMRWWRVGRKVFTGKRKRKMKSVLTYNLVNHQSSLRR